MLVVKRSDSKATNPGTITRLVIDRARPGPSKQPLNGRSALVKWADMDGLEQEVAVSVLLPFYGPNKAGDAGNNRGNPKRSPPRAHRPRQKKARLAARASAESAQTLDSKGKDAALQRLYGQGHRSQTMMWRAVTLSAEYLRFGQPSRDYTRLWLTKKFAAAVDQPAEQKQPAARAAVARAAVGGGRIAKPMVRRLSSALGLQTRGLISTTSQSTDHETEDPGAAPPGGVEAATELPSIPPGAASGPTKEEEDVAGEADQPSARGLNLRQASALLEIASAAASPLVASDHGSAPALGAGGGGGNPPSPWVSGGGGLPRRSRHSDLDSGPPPHAPRPVAGIVPDVGRQHLDSAMAAVDAMVAMSAAARTRDVEEAASAVDAASGVRVV
eukprot:SAG22_NODE_578_length_8958_cov_5.402980_5_plen_387_part_00